jgi:hypothetical protein
LDVGTDGSSAVQRIRLDTWRVDATLELGRGPLAPHYARQILAAPGSPRTVGVARSYPFALFSPSSTGIVVFDDAVQRLRVAGDLDNGPLSTIIQWGANAGTIYGANTETSDAQYSRYVVDQAGPLFDSELYGAVSAKRFAYLNGRFYESNGQVLDSSTGSVLQPSPLDFDTGPIAIDQARNRVYFVNQIRLGDTPRYEIHVVTLSTMQRRDILDLRPSPREDRLQTPFQLARWGMDGLALLIEHDRPGIAHVLLIDGPAVGL